MKQPSFAEAGYVQKKRKTRREVFLERMDSLIPWTTIEKKLSKHYPTGKGGRPPYPLQVMLRVHCLQLFYNLSDPAMEDALYELESMRRFIGLTLADRLPDETTILNFRHFLERHKLGSVVFDAVNEHLRREGLTLREGTIVYATLIAAPSSTRNQQNARDTEMKQTKKGNAWHFGMKLHIGVDETFGLIHSLATTAANVGDVTMADKLLHGRERRVWGDAGYQGVGKRAEHHGRQVVWHIAKRPGLRRQLSEHSVAERAEKAKARCRAKVEHPFLTIKRIFGYAKVRCRSLAKNENRYDVLAALTNLMRARPCPAA